MAGQRPCQFIPTPLKAGVKAGKIGSQEVWSPQPEKNPTLHREDLNKKMDVPEMREKWWVVVVPPPPTRMGESTPHQAFA